MSNLNTVEIENKRARKRVRERKGEEKNLQNNLTKQNKATYFIFLSVILYLHVFLFFFFRERYLSKEKTNLRENKVLNVTNVLNIGYFHCIRLFSWIHRLSCSPQGPILPPSWKQFEDSPLRKFWTFESKSWLPLVKSSKVR